LKNYAAVLTCVVSLVAGAASAADDARKGEPVGKEGVLMKNMTMEECKEHMAMARKDGTKRDDATLKKDTMCTDMMKKGKDPTAKKDGPSSDPIKR
jgi:hypothetical protein